MLKQSDVKKRLLINLQDTPEVALRYQNGDPLVRGMLQAQAGMIADQSADVDQAQIEPFIKSNVRTILADATNKGILPIATPCQHYIEVENKGLNAVSISAGRYIDDIQGRTWRLLQTANVGPGEVVEVQAEQSQIRVEKYQAIYTEPFHQVQLNIQEELHLSSVNIHDEQGNTYKRRKNWLNCPPGEYAFNVKTDSMRHMIIEFGDDLRCGRTVQANALLNFELIETDGKIDNSVLREASLQELMTADEGKIQLKFKTGGLIRAGADPLSIEQLRLLSSYPTHDDSDVFLGDFNYSVRKAFMSRCNYLNIWNEAVQERYYKATLDDINHLQLAFSAKNESESEQLATEIKNYIGEIDSLYKDRVHQREVEIRYFNLEVNAKLASVHSVETVKEQIITLLLSKYGRDLLASSYFLADGFNAQEIAKTLKDNIVAFQDHISDFALVSDDLALDPIKPHQWTYMSKLSITVNIKRTATSGNNLWTA